MKVTRHSLLAKGIMVLLSLLVLVFAFTYSWFSDTSAPVTASGLTVSVDNPSKDFEYAVGFSTSETGYNYFHTEFTNDVNQDLNLEQLVIDAPGNATYDGQTINVLHDYTPIDITGDGVNLVRPAMNYGNWDINTASRNFSTAEPNVQYVSFDLIFRTKSANTTIKLDKDSFAKANCETYAGDGNLNNAISSDSGESKNYNKLTNASDPTSNKYGRFSRDAIVGAVRVAFLNVADPQDELTAKQLVDEEQTEFESTPALLWIPRPDIYLKNGSTIPAGADLSTYTPAQIEEQKKKDGETTGWSLETNVASVKALISKAQVNTSYSTYEHQYYNIADVYGTQTSPSIVTFTAAVPSQLDTTASGNKVTFGQQQDLTELSYYDDSDEYYYGKIRVRIWIEGTDSESRRALAGGKFSLGFHIIG